MRLDVGLSSEDLIKAEYEEDSQTEEGNIPEGSKPKKSLLKLDRKFFGRLQFERVLTR